MYITVNVKTQYNQFQSSFSIVFIEINTKIANIFIKFI